MGKIVKVE